MPEHPLLPDGLSNLCCQETLADQNELSMLRWCIGLDLDEHPLLPIRQTAITVALIYGQTKIGSRGMSHCVTFGQLSFQAANHCYRKFFGASAAVI